MVASFVDLLSLMIYAKIQPQGLLERLDRGGDKGGGDGIKGAGIGDKGGGRRAGGERGKRGWGTEILGWVFYENLLYFTDFTLFLCT